tara:strand:+ start:391 stop:813 length:423 start_codon:yes stop_codon:yes gene_type:complete
MNLILKLLLKTPVIVYNCGGGWIFGKRFILLKHVGRVSKRIRKTPLEVIGERDGNPIVISGFGMGSDWVLNIQNNPNVSIAWGKKSLDCCAMGISKSKRKKILEEYRSRNPMLIPIYEKWMGRSWGEFENFPMYVFEVIG